jgi:hypothetical protein
VWGNNVSVETPPPAKGFWMVSPAIALAVALLIESRAESVDVGRCPACKGVRRVATVGHDRHPDADQISRGVVGLWIGGDNLWCWNEDCPACAATGRERVHAARLLLDAVPRARTADERRAMFGDNPAPTVAIGGCGDIVSTTHAPGDAPALARLLVHADQLQAAGNPLGELLSWALTLWTGEPLDCGVCPTCKGLGASIGHCSACVTGRQLGHPHTASGVADITAAWERLTVPCGNCTRSDWLGVRAHCVPCGGHGRVKPPAHDFGGIQVREPETVRYIDAGPGPNRRIAVSIPSRPFEPREWHTTIHDELARVYAADQEIERITVELDEEILIGLRRTRDTDGRDESLAGSLTSWFSSFEVELSFVPRRTHNDRHGDRALAQLFATEAARTRDRRADAQLREGIARQFDSDARRRRW